MSKRWQWANDIWNESFEPLRARGFLLDRVDREEYWRIHEEKLRAHFPPEVFINLGELRTDDAKAGLERIDTSRADNRLSDFCIVRDGDALAATFCGRQGIGGRYLQLHTHVHPDYRRRGIYKAILAGTIAYTAELGFDSIHSEHAPGNNPVIIAKLCAGFRITALEVDPMVGVSVKLTYFHNPDHLAAYEFRSRHPQPAPRRRRLRWHASFARATWLRRRRRARSMRCAKPGGHLARTAPRIH